MIKQLFKRKTREERVLQRTQSVFLELISDTEFEFSDIETVHIINNVKRKLMGHLNKKQIEFKNKSIKYTEKSLEINLAIELI